MRHVPETYFMNGMKGLAGTGRFRGLDKNWEGMGLAVPAWSTSLRRMPPPSTAAQGRLSGKCAKGCGTSRVPVSC